MTVDTDDDIWLAPDELGAWRTFIETVGDLMAAVERGLADHGTTLGDYQVLVHLSEVEDQRMRMCDLAPRLHLSPSGLTRRLDGLVRQGLVERRPSADDGRVMLAVLTDKGFRALNDAAPHHARSVRETIFDHLDNDDVDALGRIFSKIGAGLDSAD